MTKQQFGIVGLGVMGENLALNIERHGFSVAGFDLDPKKVDSFASRAHTLPVVAARTAAEFLQSLESPKRILMMVPAGKAVDAVIASLRPNLAAGDLLIDGGNTFFSDTERRQQELAQVGILYVGAGVSGGEEGALNGPSIMPGGNPAAWPLVQPVLEAIAAKADDGRPCCAWMGTGGAGHFVKMVHNGIEYGDMQMICEAYWLMEKLLGLSPLEMSRVFARWNQGELSSYLVGITAEILAKEDPETSRPLVHLILDTAEQKGTGKWTSQVALDLGVTAPTIADAVFARSLSAQKQERVAASAVLPAPASKVPADRAAFVDMIEQALFCSKICSYAQGFQLLRAGNAEYRWKLPFASIASVWTKGCIIRAQFLGRIKDAYDREPELVSLLTDPYFAGTLLRCEQAWRTVVSVAAQSGIPIPAFMSALSYYDGYRSATLPANLLQAQRDYFGAHTYQRVDREGKFHTNWNG